MRSSWQPVGEHLSPLWYGVCVCVCVCERERERECESESVRVRVSERVSERESECKGGSRSFKWGVCARKVRGKFLVTMPILLVVFACMSYVCVYFTQHIQRDIDARDWTDSQTGLALKR